MSTELDTGVRRSVLPGGLRVVTELVPGMRSATVGLWVGVGTRDEQPAVAGAAHYLEHLLFKGTAQRTATQIAEEIDAVGGELNAFTSKEYTCFYAQVLDADLPLAIDLVTDVVFEARCADADVETERGVVLEEIAMRDDDPEDLLHEVFQETIFAGHPLGCPVLGTEDSIQDLTPAAIRTFYRESYRPPEMVLAVAGNVDHDDVVRRVRKSPAVAADAVATDPAPPRSGVARLSTSSELVLRGDETEQAHLLLGTRALHRHDERRFALSVLNAALGGGMSSRLFQEIRERRGLAYQVYSATGCFADTGLFSIYAGCQPERLGAVAGVLRTTLADVVANGLTEAEIVRAKGQLRGGLVLGLEDTASRMVRLGKNELNYGRYYSVDDTVARIDAVTVGDVAEIAATVLRDIQAVAVVGPYSRVDELPDEVHEVMA
ncbi:pitrilysin family protein [Haloechinothrix salitolerans]|uniref:Pitrilysin family protein n=1 Tax=Haloechinothrix salitolerans TaxID=926830 RepID=A0ABW2C0H8_9PSEU